MSTKKIEIQDSNGNIYYPHTDASVVKNGSNTVAEQLNDLANPSIFINSGFQIWQRGTSFSEKTKFTADRWYLTFHDNNSVTVSKIDGGLSLKVNTFSSVSGSFVNFEYHFDLDHYSKLVGKTVTISIKLKEASCIDRMGLRAYPDNTAKSWSNTEAKDYYEWTTVIPECSTTCTKFIFFLQKLAVGEVKFEYIKMEIGSKATPFIPRPYGEELSSCQRYYWKNNVWQRHRANTVYGNSMDFFIPLPVSMRIVPTIVDWSSTFYNLCSLNQATKVPISSTTIYMGDYNNGIQLRCITDSAHGLTDGSIELNATFALDAEIY